MVVDGNSGTVYVRPGPDVLAEYRRLDSEYRAFQRGLEHLRDLPAETLDGHRVSLLANVGLIGELDLIVALRRRGHRPVPHRVPVPVVARLPERGRAAQPLPARVRAHARTPGDDPHARPRRRQAPAVRLPGPRAQSLPRPAVDPPVARVGGLLPRADPRDPARRRGRSRCASSSR